jgi:hypothetical protein
MAKTTTESPPTSGTARALATAVLEGDAAAADALVDWIYENRNHGGYDVLDYTTKLEDCLREVKRTVMKGRVPRPSLVVLDADTATLADCVLTKGDVDKVYNLCFALERMAANFKRVGPA